jgi:hypothetical protein
MKLLLERDIKTKDFTLGKLYIDGQFAVYTCEEAITPTKIKGESAIPSGVYRVIINFSNRFQKHLPLLLDVPGFTGIRIHSGNVAKNRPDGTDDTEGCILLGTGRKDGEVTNSRLAMSVLMPRIEEGLQNGVVTIEIR